MLLFGLWASLQSAIAAPCPTGTIKRHGKIKHESITEASGLIVTDNWLWVHNDSGDAASLYAITKEGESRASIMVEGAFAKDWEDMTHFSDNGQSYFLIGDIGDNKERNASVTFYVIKQPTSNTAAKLLYTFTATYADIGPKDAEAVVVDPQSKELLLITKGRDGVIHFLQGKFPLPSELSSEAEIKQGHGETIQDPSFNAQQVSLSEIHQIPFATPPLDRREQSRLITSAAIHPSGHQLIIRNYLSARLYQKEQGQTWAEAVQQEPCRLPLPLQPQGETLAFSPDGKSLWTLSEGNKPSLYEIRLQQQ